MIPQGGMPPTQQKTSNFDRLIMKLQLAFPKYNRFLDILSHYVDVDCIAHVFTVSGVYVLVVYVRFHHIAGPYLPS
jgi:hypothetical protein